MLQKQDILGSDVLDHLGLVAATIDKLGIVKEIDKRLPMTKGAKTMLWHLGNQLFGCLNDMDKELLQINNKLTYHKVNYSFKTVPTYQKKGGPKKEDKPERIAYQVEALLLRDEVAIEQSRLSKGRFILATNQLDKEQITSITNNKKKMGYINNKITGFIVSLSLYSCQRMHVHMQQPHDAPCSSSNNATNPALEADIGNKKIESPASKMHKILDAIDTSGLTGNNILSKIEEAKHKLGINEMFTLEDFLVRAIEYYNRREDSISVKIVSALIDGGADVNVLNALTNGDIFSGETILFNSLYDDYGNYRELTKFLLEKVNINNLSCYIKNSRFDEDDLRFICIAGLLPDDKVLCTLLHKAAMIEADGYQETGKLVKFLLKNKAEVNAVTEKHKLTALDIAASQGNIEMVKILLANGASPYRGDPIALAHGGKERAFWMYRYNAEEYEYIRNRSSGSQSSELEDRIDRFNRIVQCIEEHPKLLDLRVKLSASLYCNNKPIIDEISKLHGRIRNNKCNIPKKPNIPYDTWLGTFRFLNFDSVDNALKAFLPKLIFEKTSSFFLKNTNNKDEIIFGNKDKPGGKYLNSIQKWIKSAEVNEGTSMYEPDKVDKSTSTHEITSGMQETEVECVSRKEGRY